MASDDLNQIYDWLDPLLKGLSPGARNKNNKQLASGLRSRQARRIKQQKNPDGSPFEARKKSLRTKKGRIKKRAEMFRTLRTMRHLKGSASANHIGVGYRGGAARIARVHQEGFTDRVSRDGPLYQYPMRKLLGMSTADAEWLIDDLKKRLIL